MQNAMTAIQPAQTGQMQSMKSPEEKARELMQIEQQKQQAVAVDIQRREYKKAMAEYKLGSDRKAYWSDLTVALGVGLLFGAAVHVYMQKRGA